MKIFRSLYIQLSSAFIGLIILVCLSNFVISTLFAKRFERTLDQKANWGIASHFADRFDSLLNVPGNKTKLRAEIRRSLQINPWVQIYFIYEDGNVHPLTPGYESLLRKQVETKPIRQFFKAKAKNKPKIIRGTDPRTESSDLAFSAEKIRLDGADAILYVTIGSREAVIVKNLALQTLEFTSTTFIVLLTVAAQIGLLLLFFLTRRFGWMTQSLTRFQNGNLDERIKHVGSDQVGQLASKFNQMAEAIQKQIGELSERDELRRKLISNVSHDLRSPLTSLHGYLETILLKDKELSPEQRNSYLEIALSNTESLEKLIEDLFELSKLEAGYHELEEEAFRIDELADQIICNLRAKAEGKSIGLFLDLEASIEPVFADIALIERALTNLVENAINYTSESGEVRVVLSQEEGLVIIEIKDNGIGVPKNEISQIWQATFRGERSRSRQQNGSGLGLSIVKEILDLHQQSISVLSEKELGTVFRFQLPLAVGA